MEIWDLYDENRIKLNKTHIRGEVMPKGAYHTVVHICIFDKNGNMLIQQRQPWKDGWPNMWDITVGGSIQIGESSRQGAMRETLEEIGYKVDLSNELPYFTIHTDTCFDDFYLIDAPKDFCISNLNLQYEEVQAVKWANRDEILAMIDEGIFINYNCIYTIFEMKKARGGHKSI